MELDEEKLELLPRFVKSLQHASDDDYKRLRKNLEKAYRFHFPQYEVDPMALPQYDDSIKEDVEEIPKFFASVERDVLDDVHTLEYFRARIDQYKKDLTEISRMSPAIS